MPKKTKVVADLDELLTDRIEYKAFIDSWRGILFVSLPEKAIRECGWCYSGRKVEVTIKPVKEGS